MVLYLVGALIALALVVWLAPKALRWAILFSSWVSELPLPWMLLLFIVFPPAFFVFLFSMGLHQLGLSKRILDLTDPSLTDAQKSRVEKGYVP